MQSIKVVSRVGSDGILHLDVPVGMTNEELEVMVIFQPLKSSVQSETPQLLGWMSGFFEEVIGGWVGEPLERGKFEH
ncbi:hypothetical protein NIES4101_26490 (plasmid) [Calothrix sp. NIES-4101]|nr:hypothetical protein NIES4101_26490 [Calothrix sp. NIES-4101]